MPAGIPQSPGALPLQFLIRKFGAGKPENKIRLVFLVFVLLHVFPDAHLQLLLLLGGQHIVVSQAGGVKIYIVPRHIGIALFQQYLYHMYEVVDAVGGGLHHVRPFDGELAAVLHKGVGVVSGNVHDAFVLPPGAGQHFVLAGIAVARQMAHVGNIHDSLYIISHKAEIFFQHILHDITAQIPDMRIVVHRGAACIHGHLTRLDRYKFLYFFAQCII